MGWTYYHATEYKNGKVDRKQELMNTFNFKKVCMVGSVAYCAVEYNDGTIGAYVVLTNTNMRDYFNFGYKEMSETMLPFFYDCPNAILKMLSPTDDENANEWRNLCKKNTKKKDFLSKCPVGTVIEYTDRDRTVRIEKCSPAYQFKTNWWYDAERNCYVSKKRLPMDYTVVA